MAGDKKPFEVKTYNKGQLVGFYEASYKLLRKWLVEEGQVFTPEYYDGRNVFTPADVQKIINYLGSPLTYL